MTPFRVVQADPPWKFGDRLPGPKRGATCHYRTMSTLAICALRLCWARFDDACDLFRDDNGDVTHLKKSKEHKGYLRCKACRDAEVTP